MKRRTIARILTAACFAVMVGLALHHRTEKYRRDGRHAYIARAEHQWDRHYAGPNRPAAHAVLAICLCGVGIAAYEIVVAGLVLLLSVGHGAEKGTPEVEPPAGGD